MSCLTMTEYKPGADHERVSPFTEEEVMKRYQKPQVVGSSNVHPC